MKKLFQISFVFLYFFLLNGNSFLYAHTKQGDKTISLEKVASHIKNLESDPTRFTLQTDSVPSEKQRNKRFKFPLFEKEEKEDKTTSLEEFFSTSSSFVYFFNVPLLDRFYHYNKNYLHISESLNYFLFHKCYILFRVFRL